MRWLTYLIVFFITFIGTSFGKTFYMEIYGDCYYYHLTTEKVCQHIQDLAVYVIWSEFYTSEKNGKKYYVRYVYCSWSGDNDRVKLYIYMTPEDIKQCNKKPELNVQVQIEKQ
jgi:hypothetical protein